MIDQNSVKHLLTIKANTLIVMMMIVMVIMITVIIIMTTIIITSKNNIDSNSNRDYANVYNANNDNSIGNNNYDKGDNK